MSEQLSPCPECGGTYVYESGEFLACPECGHEWSPAAEAEAAADSVKVVRDAVGNVLADGDTVTVIKDLKVGNSAIKVGTKVQNIRLIEDGVGDHDIDCKVPGFGAMQLKSSVVKKA